MRDSNIHVRNLDRTIRGSGIAVEDEVEVDFPRADPGLDGRALCLL